MHSQRVLIRGCPVCACREETLCPLNKEQMKAGRLCATLFHRRTKAAERIDATVDDLYCVKRHPADPP